MLRHTFLFLHWYGYADKWKLKGVVRGCAVFTLFKINVPKCKQFNTWCLEMVSKWLKSIVFRWFFPSSFNSNLWTGSSHGVKRKMRSFNTSIVKPQKDLFLTFSFMRTVDLMLRHETIMLRRTDFTQNDSWQAGRGNFIHSHWNFLWNVAILLAWCFLIFQVY